MSDVYSTVDLSPDYWTLDVTEGGGEWSATGP